jgi:DoxX-like family
MSTAYVVFTLLAAAALTFSVWADFFLRERVAANMERAGVPESWLPRLAALKAAGALGLVIGLAVPAIGIAAAVGVVLYFVGAIIFHLRARWYDVSYPSVYLLLATASLAFGLAS